MTNPYNYHKLREKLDRINSRRLTIAQIARDLGYTPVYIQKILSGEKFYEPAVRKVARAIGVPWKELLQVKGEK